MSFPGDLKVTSCHLQFLVISEGSCFAVSVDCALPREELGTPEREQKRREKKTLPVPCRLQSHVSAWQGAVACRDSFWLLVPIYGC